MTKKPDFTLNLTENVIRDKHSRCIADLKDIVITNRGIVMSFDERLGMVENEPLPCPLCGSLQVDICRTNPKACWVRCGECGMDAPAHASRKRAIATWNSRPVTYGVAKIVQDDEAE